MVCLLKGFSKLAIRVLRERDAERRDCPEPRTKRSELRPKSWTKRRRNNAI